MIDLETAEVREIVSYFSQKVNSFLFKPDAAALEQKDSQQMKDLDLSWIRVLSSPSYRTDLRNEASARTGKQLAEISFVKKAMELTDNPKMKNVAESMAMDHRTLQQTFSGLVFCHFLLSCDKEDSEKLIAVMGESFYRLPLI